MTDPAHSRDTSLVSIFHGIGADVRQAFRMLVKNKGLAATALITLALCIGANTAIFSALYALVIKPLPYPEPGRMVEIYNSFPKAGLNNFPSNVAQYLDFKQNTDAFQQLALWQRWDCTLGDDDGPVRVTAVQATAGMFEVLGVQPLLGSFFRAENSEPGSEKVLVLTQSFWEANFQDDPAVVGRTLVLDNETYTIVGVAPRVFEAFDARVKFVRPIAWPPDQVANFPRYACSLRLYGRLNADATVAKAFAQVDALEQAFYDQSPPRVRDFLDRSGHIIGVNTLHDQRVEPVRTRLLLLQGGVLFVLLIGCVNVANLLLARSNARQGEIAICIALGAGRGVIARQLFIEGALVTGLGAALGLGLAWSAIRVVNHFSSQLMPSALPFTIDGRVLAYTAGIAAAMAVFISMAPIVHVWRSNLLGLLQGQTRSSSGGRGIRTMSSALVVGQTAVALLLLIIAGLLIRSFAQVVAVDPGFDSQQVVAARIALPPEYRKDDRMLQFQEQLLAAVQQIPGVDSASIATATPLETGLPVNAFTLRDYTLPEGASQPGAYHLGATPSYLQTMRIPLLEGRWFDATDTDKSRSVYVVDEAFARRYFPNGSAVGKHFTFGSPPEKPEDWPEIVGVVGKVYHLGVEESSGNPFIYYPLKQTRAGGFSLLVCSPRPTSEVVAVVREKLRALDSGLPLFQVDAMDNVVANSFNERRLLMLLLGALAGIALLLSAVGIYGVLAYDVSQRTREIGIRGAIGASREQVIGLILRQGLWKTGIGLALGMVGAAVLSRYLKSFLYGVQAIDPLAYGGVALLLLGVGLLASYLPARRAARIDPIVALREE